MASKVVMRETDMIELYQLLKVYKAVYGERNAAQVIMDDLRVQYKNIWGTRFSEIDEARNPRGAGRSRIYTEEEDASVLDLYNAGGMSLREIARDTGCSLGHVQDVIKRSRTGGQNA